MKLALFHPAFNTVGGAEILVAEQAKMYVRCGLDVRMVTFAHDAKTWDSRLGDLPVQVVKKRHWTDCFRSWSRLEKLMARGRRASEAFTDLDVVVAHNFPCSAMLGAFPMNARRVWQCNEPPRNLHLRAANPRMLERTTSHPEDPSLAIRDFRRALHRYDRNLRSNTALKTRHAFDLSACKHLDEIYAISEFSRDNARNIYGRCREEVIYPIVRFPNGGRNRHGLNRENLQILVHGRLDVYKNVDTVIQGFAHFHKRHPGARLHVVGEGPLRAHLERLAEDLVPGAVAFHGFLPESALREVYEACDVFSLLTLDEPFGMVFPEAAAKGLLLVGPDHGGPLEILDGGRLGWVCDPFDPLALADVFASILALSDAEVDTRREQADLACRSRFSEETLRPQLLSVLER